ASVCSSSRSTTPPDLHSFPTRRSSDLDVVEPQLEELQKILSGHALLALGPLEVLAELALQHPVDTLGLLLLAELDPVRRGLAPVQAMLAGRIVPPLDRALVGEAAGALEE